MRERQLDERGGGPGLPLVDRYRTCASADLAALYAELGGGARALDAQRLAIAAVLDEREAWQVDGARDMTGWVAGTDALRRRTAKGFVEVARALVSLPAIAQAAADGRLSFDQLRPLCQLATAETDARWAEEGPCLEPSQLAAQAAKATRVEREATQEQEGRRAFNTWRARGGGVRGSFYLPDVDAEVLTGGLDRLASRYSPVPGEPWEPLQVRRADALVDLASMALADTRGAGPAHIYVHAQAGAFGQEGDGWVTLADGTAIARSTLERLGCDATTQLLLHDPSGAFNAIGVATHDVPRRIRRLLTARDRCCRFPGCEMTLGLHAHHIRFWSRRGKTQVDNLVMVCRRHHKLVHEGGWTLTGNPDQPTGLTFTSPTGRSLTIEPDACMARVRDRLIPEPPDPLERARARRRHRSRLRAEDRWPHVDITRDYADLQAARTRLRDAILRPTIDHGS